MSDPRTGQVEVREMVESEREAVRELTLKVYGEYERIMEPSAWEGLRGAVEAALDTPLSAQRIVALRDEQLVGSVMLFPASEDVYRGAAEPVPWPELRLLAVTPDARGSGVGQRLVEEVIRHARVSGASHLGLHTSRSMADALRMYERMGFLPDPANDFFPDGVERVLAYRLALQ